MKAVKSLVEAELRVPVQLRVAEMARAIAEKYGAASRAVLFYGSCLRTSELEGQMLDFYLIVSDYEAAYGKSWLVRANRLIPPNVFPFEHDGLAAKYAVLSEADFRRECGPDARTVSVWARFAQPSRLVWAADDEAVKQVVDSVSCAGPTLLGFAAAMTEGSDDGLAIWRRGFALTYGCELRAERTDRSSSIVDADPERYRSFAAAALPNLPVHLSRQSAERLWAGLRRRGKRASVLRLVKASGTFAGGIDYLAWKINRHAGTEIRITPWQRKWPLLAAITLLPQLLRRGAVR